MPDDEAPNRFLCVAVDIQRYSDRDMAGQASVQRELRAALQAAARDARIDRMAWRTQEQGDGELALVPAGPDEPRVIGEFVSYLDARLAAVNAPRRPEARIRLRVAFHSGWAHRADLGYAGPDVVVVARLVGAPQLKVALDAAGTANIGVIASESAFAIVRQGLTTLPADEFVPVDVRVGTYAGAAWMWLPAAGRRAEPVPPHSAADPRPPGQPAVHVATNQGVVITGGGVTGPVAVGPGATANQYGVAEEDQ